MTTMTQTTAPVTLENTTTELTAKQKNRAFFRNKQRGAMIMDNMIASSFVAIALILILTAMPTINYKMNLSNFQKQETDIAMAAVSWKKARSNYTGVNMKQLCDRQLVSKSICGASNDGKNTNAFGGNWTVAANPTSPGTFQVQATLPNLTGETGRLNDVADTMAPNTRKQCESATNCASITGAGSTTLTMIH
ncbi:hypothetical protein ACPV5G_20215 [Photobacterium damselae]|uniref:hypothetical protein n=1 Tax=Photobacterium damselae TaxID=38293 RepID=UPI0040685CA1